MLWSLADILIYAVVPIHAGEYEARFLLLRAAVSFGVGYLIGAVVFGLFSEVIQSGEAG